MGATKSSESAVVRTPTATPRSSEHTFNSQVPRHNYISLYRERPQTRNVWLSERIDGGHARILVLVALITRRPIQI